MDLAGKTVLMVGGTSGIGRRIASDAVVAGARVVLTSRRPRAAEEVAADLGDGATPAVLDLADESSVADLAARLGTVDHVVSVAADHANGPLAQLVPSEVTGAFQAKVIGPILLAKHVAPRMPPGGALVLFSGYASARPAPGLTVMATTNGAVDALVPALAVEVAPVRVVAVSPGVVDSGSWDGLGPDKAPFFARTAAGNPARRVGTPADVSDAVLFALRNPFLTATTLHVDGGERVA
ncbi:SDR family oxidoreductase [Cellulosimicrobium cellulans]|uniref:SDR family oxidoreductase n=1 Tax=Cellulosimicrobium cellulans TaxID=1710 RepID=UPI000848AAB4|nr:SDR family oxidoreductase [Cellulosimicrobium cellulans]